MSLSGQNLSYQDNDHKVLEKQPTKVLMKQPTKVLEKQPSIVLERQPSKTYEKKQTINLGPTQKDELRVHVPTPLDLSAIKESKNEGSQISPRKHKILNDLMNQNNEAEIKLNHVSSKEENKEEQGIFSNFFSNIFKNSEEKTHTNSLTKNQIEQSKYLKEIYADDLSKPPQKGKLAVSRLLTNLNDMMEPDQKIISQPNADLEHFLTSRVMAQRIEPVNVQNTQNFAHPVVSHSPSLSHSVYSPPTQLPHDIYKPHLSSSFYQSNANQYNPISQNYQPVMRSTMSNEEVKRYLQSLDVYLGQSIKKPSPPTRSSYEDHSIARIKTYEPIIEKSYRFEKTNNGGMHLSAEGQEGDMVADIEELEELRQKYFRSNSLNRSAFLFKKNSKSMEISAFTDVRVGDIICANCEEFMTPEELDKHSNICTVKLNEIDLKRLNQKIEKMKYLIIINFKNIEPAKRQSYLELEELMNLGTIIIDEIVENNKHVEKLRENMHDFETLIKNLPTLKNKNNNVFNVLSQRIIFLALKKSEELVKFRPKEIEPLYIDIPHGKIKKKKLMKKTVKMDGGCCGCCGREIEYHEEVSFDDVRIKTMNKERKYGTCGLCGC